MSKRAHAAGLALFVGIAVAASANGCSSDEYVVGGECVPPLTQCGHACVDVSSDTSNCGACGNACAPGVACNVSICSGTLDGSTDAHGDSTTDGTTPLDGTSDGTTDGTTDGTIDDDSGDSGTKDGSLHPDGGDGATTDGSTSDVEAGDDGSDDSGDAEITEGGDAEAGIVCLPPTMLCHGMCIDTTSDPSNCGACDNVCPAFLCTSSQCVSGFNGEVVLLGEDFVSRRFR